MSLSDLLQYAQQNTSGRGLFLASRYLTDVAGCLSGGLCPTQVMGLTSREEWEKSLLTSSRTLTATAPEWGFDEKSLGTERGYILTATGIMSTSRMDSDRDILEAKGAEVEPVCPYLWHHISIQPVGKVLETSLSTLKQGKEEVDTVLFKCGILDVGNGLGRDTALLIEMGAIRNSHGFEPLEYKPLKEAGWHILKYRTFEISAVTIPANRDAVFTEYSSDKSRFRSDLVKHWIKGHFDQRQKVWSGWEAPESSSAVEEVPQQKTSEEQEVAAVCTCQKQKTEPAVRQEKIYLPGLPGSWEWLQAQLRRAVHNYLKENPAVPPDYYYAELEATYNDYVIVCAYRNDGDKRYYRINWTVADGTAVLFEEFTEVTLDFDMTLTEVEKASDRLRVSAEVHFKMTPVSGGEVPPVEKPVDERKTLSSSKGSVGPVQVRVVDPVLASLGL